MEDTKKILLVINNSSTTDIPSLQEWMQTLPAHTDVNLLLVKKDISTLLAAFSASYINEAKKADIAARASLARTGKALGIQAENQWLVSGDEKNQGKQLAKQLQAEPVYASTLGLTGSTTPMTPFISRFASFIRLNT